MLLRLNSSSRYDVHVSDLNPKSYFNQEQPSATAVRYISRNLSVAKMVHVDVCHIDVLLEQYTNRSAQGGVSKTLMSS